MKQKLQTLMMLLLTFAFTANAQQYVITSMGVNSGNPGGVRTSSDTWQGSSSSGYTTALAYNAGSSSSNVWSDTVGIPFAFEFYGSSVSHFCVNKNGLVTFDTSVANNAVDTALMVNQSLPNASVPNNTIAFWGDFTPNPPLGSNDNVRVGIEGTAPNRQQWIVYHSYEMDGASYSYFAIVLEESTNKIYLVDMNYNYFASTVTPSITKGIQINATSAFEVSGSPNIPMSYVGTSGSDNSYEEFAYYPAGACIPPSITGTSVYSGSSAGVNLSANGNLAFEIEYGPSGYTVGSGTNMSGYTTNFTLNGLSGGTTYDVYARSYCGGTSGYSAWVGPVSVTTAMTPPYFNDFSPNYTGSGFTEAQGNIASPTVFTSTSSGWTNDTWLNGGTNQCAKENLYSAYDDEWMFSPVFDLGIGTNNYSLEFDLAITPWNGTTGGASLGADDSVMVVISTDGGQTWDRNNALLVLSSSSTTGAAGDHYTIPLSGYFGLVQFGFYDETTVSGTDLDIFVDNFEISQPVLNCPVNDTVTASGNPSCGASSVTLNASAHSTDQTVLWMNSSGEVVGSGDSYETPVITANTNFGVALYADDNTAAPVSFGPPTTLTGGFGNYSNGMWFTALAPFTLDSISVVSNGLVNFQVRISEGGGSKSTGHQGDELQRSDTITVSAAGTHQVPVGLTIAPGTYYINMAFLSGTTGQLHRATTGGAYPYTAAGVATLDSVQFGSTNDRVYYAYDWVVSAGCIGTVSTATAVYASVPSVSIPYSEDFNNGLACNWTTMSTGAEWVNVGYSNVSPYYTAGTLDSAGFMFIDDDAAGSSVVTSASLMSPVFNAVGYDTLTLEFDHHVYSAGDRMYVEVYDGSSWVSIDTITGSTGSWSAPAHAMYDVSAYQNADFQVNLTYDDNGGWQYYAAIDNFMLDGALAPCTNVRVEILNDIYGSEISWYIEDINTGQVWASGGPYTDVSPYNAAASLHVDTVCIPDNGTYEFRINDSYGDGLTDGTNAGWYQVDVLCPWGDNRILTIDTTLVSPYNSATWGPFPYGGTSNPPMYDSAVFTTSCVQYTNVTFQVDMNKVTQGFTTPEVNGTWNNWCGNCNAMTDADGDNVWEVTLPLEQGTTVEFKYSADSWTIQEMNDPTASCTNGNATYTNRVLTIPAADTVLPVVCWSSCDACSIEVTFNVNMAWEVANNAIDSNGVHVAGSFQGWSPSTTEMTDPDGDGIYSVTVEMPLNQDLFYKFINGNDWAMAEASGDLAACGVSDGFGGYNRSTSVGNADTSLAAVCFTKCYDCAVSIDEALGNISLFPNPTSGAFTMERSELAGNIEVTVIGLQGQLLLATEWAAGQSELNIDLSDLAAGVYMVRLTAEEGTRTLRVAVQR